MADNSILTGARPKVKGTKLATPYTLPEIPTDVDEAELAEFQKGLLGTRKVLRTARTNAMTVVQAQVENLAKISRSGLDTADAITALREKAAVAHQRYDDLVRICYLFMEMKVSNEVSEDDFAAQSTEEIAAQIGLDSDVQMCIAKYTPKPRAVVRGEEDDDGRLNIVKLKLDDLKPQKVLKRESSLPQFNQWLVAANAYYFAARYDHASVAQNIRQVAMAKFIEAGFYEEMVSQMSATSYFFDDEMTEEELLEEDDNFQRSLESLLVRHFHLLNPIIKLRDEFFRTVPGENEPFSKWLSRLKQMYTIAKLGEMKPQEVMMQHILLHVKPQKLFEKLWDGVKEADKRGELLEMADVERIGTSFFGGQVVEKLNKGQDVIRRQQHAEKNAKKDQKGSGNKGPSKGKGKDEKKPKKAGGGGGKDKKDRTRKAASIAVALALMRRPLVLTKSPLATTARKLVILRQFADPRKRRRRRPRARPLCGVCIRYTTPFGLSMQSWSGLWRMTPHARDGISLPNARRSSITV